MAIEDDSICMHHVLEKLGEIKTETDLNNFKEVIKEKLAYNAQWRIDNPTYLDFLTKDQFDVISDINNTTDKSYRRRSYR